MDSALYRFYISIINLYVTIKASRSPNPPAEGAERTKYEADKSTSDIISSIIWWYIPLGMIFVYMPHFIEEYVIISSIYPSFAIPPFDIFISEFYTLHSSTLDSFHRIGITPAFILGTFMVYAGAAIRILCYRYLGKQFTFELSTRKEDKLITDGPYAIVRHPSYIGSISKISGMLICEFGAGSWWAEFGLGTTMYGKVYTALVIFLCMVLLTSLIRRIPKEDKLLKKEFGKQWDEWAKRTPYRLLPGLH